MAKRLDVLLYGMNYAPELTGIGRYSGELARGLASRGLSVEVVTTPPHYPGWFVRAPHSNRAYTRAREDGVTVWRCPILLHKAGKGFWRMMAPLSFALSSLPVAVWRILLKRPRTVLCVEPTLFGAPAALLAAKLIGARTVLHVQDLEVDAAFAVGHLKDGGRLARLAAWFDRSVLGAFDHVVTISNQMAARLREKGVPRARMSVIRNWVDTSKIFPLGRPSAYRAELGFSSDDFIVLYSGQIGAKQALHVVFETAEALVNEPGIHFVVAGEGPLKSGFVERYGQLPNVLFLGLQPEDRLNEFLNLADCHILPQDPAVKDLVLPSKVGGMLASGKTVLVMADKGSELADFLEGSATVVPTGVQEGLIKAMLGMIAQRADSSDRGVILAQTLKFDESIRRFADILTSALQPGDAL